MISPTGFPNFEPFLQVILVEGSLCLYTEELDNASVSSGQTWEEKKNIIKIVQLKYTTMGRDTIIDYEIKISARANELLRCIGKELGKGQVQCLVWKHSETGNADPLRQNLSS